MAGFDVEFECPAQPEDPADAAHMGTREKWKTWFMDNAVLHGGSPRFSASDDGKTWHFIAKFNDAKQMAKFTALIAMQTGLKKVSVHPKPRAN